MKMHLKIVALVAIVVSGSAVAAVAVSKITAEKAPIEEIRIQKISDDRSVNSTPIDVYLNGLMPSVDQADPLLEALRKEFKALLEMPMDKEMLVQQLRTVIKRAVDVLKDSRIISFVNSVRWALKAKMDQLRDENFNVVVFEPLKEDLKNLVARYLTIAPKPSKGLMKIKPVDIPEERPVPSQEVFGPYNEPPLTPETQIKKLIEAV